MHIALFLSLRPLPPCLRHVWGTWYIQIINCAEIQWQEEHYFGQSPLEARGSENDSEIMITLPSTVSIVDPEPPYADPQRAVHCISDS